jgi:PAS domain S-box-containing protein
MSLENNEFTLFLDFPHPVFLMTPDGTILEANHFYANRFNCTIDEIRGKNIFEQIVEGFHDPEIAARRKARTDTVVATGQFTVFDDEQLDGAIIRSAVYPVKSPEGTVTRLLVMARDVTKEIAAKKKAYHTDLVYKALLDAVPGSVFILDNEFLLISGNHFAFNLFGDRRGQINNNDFFNLVFSDDQPRMKKLLTDLMESGSVKADQVRMHTREDRKNFNWFNIHIRKAFIENRIYLVVVCVDISKLKNSESHLIEYKKWLTRAMEAGSAGVWDWNIKTDAGMWSNSMWKMFGLEKLPGQYPDFKLWASTIHPDDRDMVLESITKAIAIRADMQLEYRILHPDGSCHWLLEAAKPVYGKDGEVSKYCGISIDITNHKQFDAENLLIQEHLDYVLEKFHIGWFHINLKDHSSTRTIEHARIFGYDSLDMEWSFEKFIEHIVDEDRERVRNLVLTSIANKKDFLVESRIRNTNGDIRNIWATVSIIYDDHKQPAHLVGIVQDITDRVIPVS